MTDRKRRGYARLASLLILGFTFMPTGCKKDEPYSVKERSYPGLTKIELEPSPPTPTPSSPEAKDSSPGPDWIVVDHVSNVAQAVQKEAKQADSDGKVLVVYVGAVWCKPCKEFDEAAKRDDFGAELNHVRLMKFDWDRHQSPLNRANYGSQYLPLFVMPGGDGKGTDKRFFGSRYKGQKGIDDLKKRLAELTSKG